MKLTLDGCIIEFDPRCYNSYLVGAVEDGGRAWIDWMPNLCEVIETAEQEAREADDAYRKINERWPLDELEERIPPLQHTQLLQLQAGANNQNLSGYYREDCEDQYVRAFSRVIAVVDPAGVFDNHGWWGSGFVRRVGDLPLAKLPGRDAYFLSKNIQLTRRDQLPAELRQYATITDREAA